ncbi:cytochrome P450 [Streptomyces luteireticuli]|uniref:Polyprenyl synthetase family protein n=1 Tax=Streptomyces luteireticuli TaxID=173858 RepID=A0ABP3I8L3_9ACTN
MGGYRVPEGSWLVIPLRALHRDPAVFPHPDVFDPGRWQTRTAESSAMDPSTDAYLPYGLGPRRCAGASLADTAAPVALAAIAATRTLMPVRPGGRLRSRPGLVDRPGRLMVTAVPRHPPGTGRAAHGGTVPSAAAPTPVPSPVLDEELRERWHRTARWIDTHIDRLYPAAPAPSLVTAWIPPDSAALPAGTGSAEHLARRLHRALVIPVRHLTEAGGHRWRPALAAEVIAALDGDAEACGPLIAALELIHTGALIVDDVQDGSPTRRGRPAAHTAFGAALALNGGTAAYFAFDRAIELAFSDDPPLCGGLREACLAGIRAAHTGQALDLQGHREEMDVAVDSGDPRQVLGLVRLTHRLKSGAPVGAALTAAALLTGADPPLRRALADFGTAVGTAYQMTDDVADLLGVTRDGVATKRVAEDLRAGKVTLPLAHAVTLLPRPRLRRLWRLVRDGVEEGDALAGVTAEVVACGAAEACTAEAESLVAGAWAGLGPLLPPGPRGRRLHDMARHIIRINRIA